MNIEKIISFNNRYEKEIDTPTLKIKENTLIFEKKLIQINNIPQISIYPVTGQAIPVHIPVTILFGMVLIDTSGIMGDIWALCF